MVDENDAELLRRYAEDGAELAFAVLVQRHLRLVYTAALRRTNGDPHLAADVSQAVFTALARGASSLQRHRLLAGWLYTATRNAALNVMREEKRRRMREQEVHLMQQSETTAGSLPRRSTGAVPARCTRRWTSSGSPNARRCCCAFSRRGRLHRSAWCWA